MLMATRTPATGTAQPLGPEYGFWWPRTDSQKPPKATSATTARYIHSSGRPDAKLRPACQVVWSSRAAACRGSKRPPFLAAAVSGVGFMVPPSIYFMS